MALRLAGRCAEVLGRDEDAERFLEEALALKESINSQLVSEQTGVYLLNIDYQGTRHHDLTGDMIFPVLFGVATDELKERVLGDADRPRTSGPSTACAPWPRPAGLRSRAGPAPAGRRLAQPDRLGRLCRAASSTRSGWWRPCATSSASARRPEPIGFKNVVPGQFPERLHGENYQSRGMALSPWMPPTFLWLAMDGLLGFRPTLDRLIVQPHLPESWQWVAVRNFPYAGCQPQPLLLSRHPLQHPGRAERLPGGAVRGGRLRPDRVQCLPDRPAPRPGVDDLHQRARAPGGAAAAAAAAGRSRSA